MVGKPRVGGSADIAGGEVREEGVLTWPAVAVTFIASRLAAEQIVALLLLRRKLRLLGENRVEFRSERRHLGRSFIAGDRLRHLIEGRADAAAIDRAQMDRQRIGRGRRPGSVAER